jgi:hypothetical protein
MRSTKKRVDPATTILSPPDLLRIHSPKWPIEIWTWAAGCRRLPMACTGIARWTGVLQQRGHASFGVFPGLGKLRFFLLLENSCWRTEEHLSSSPSSLKCTVKNRRVVGCTYPYVQQFFLIRSKYIEQNIGISSAGQPSSNSSVQETWCF